MKINQIPFRDTSTVELMQMILRDLKERGEPIRALHDKVNKKALRKSIYRITEMFDEFPLTEPDVLRLWEIHSKLKHVSRNFKRSHWLNSTFVTLDMPVTSEYLAEVEMIRHSIYGMIRSIESARMFATNLYNLGNANRSAVDALRQDMSVYLGYLRDTAPYSLCPYCKGIEFYQQLCESCHSVGWVDYNTFKKAPDQLTKEKTVLYNGNIIDIKLALEERQRELSKTRPA